MGVKVGDPRNDKAFGLGQAHVARELTSDGHGNG